MVPSNQVHLQKQEHIFCAAFFRSLFFEACGRTVNPVNGDVGLLWTGNWHMCQAAVETVLQGGSLRSMRIYSVSTRLFMSLLTPAPRGEVTCADARKL
ncbi:hypothetical protein AHAS_Ahas01G0294300 [Arachis hypogaea]|uniref:LOB domain-containing protein n=1 Tax=Arachis hypogaea TaxID=3818 RepID=A0A445EK05_ARAHY|nr:hypothetical protein Ahy_A01g000373 [Arachis hypogaea]